MKKIFYILILVSFSIQLLGQTNLVINPSFESYTTCPAGGNGNIEYTGNWTAYRESPDYFNSCAGPTAIYSVPNNGFGYQTAASGNAYVGFVAGLGTSANAREVLGSQLSQTMTIGQKYYISLKVNLSSFGTTNPWFVPCNKIGLKFSTVAFSTVTPVPINNMAHLYTNTIISDTMNWTIISGSFFADSSYKYVMIGNFFDDANTDTTKMAYGGASYFHADDICVSTSSITCPVLTNIKENSINENVAIYPNPVNSFLTISNSSQVKSYITITNLIGIELYKNNFVTHLQMDLSSYDNGIYFIYIRQDNTDIVKKVIVRH